MDYYNNENSWTIGQLNKSNTPVLIYFIININYWYYNIDPS